MYADYAYYQGTYHGTALSEEQWPAAAREADAWLDRLTLGRLQRGAPVDDAVRMAACALAEVAGRYQTAAAERTPGLASATNDGYSESYAGTAADLVEQEQAELQAAADLYLPRTHPLRYRGCGCYAVLRRDRDALAKWLPRWPKESPTTPR